MAKKCFLSFAAFSNSGYSAKPSSAYVYKRIIWKPKYLKKERDFLPRLVHCHFPSILSLEWKFDSRSLIHDGAVETLLSTSKIK
jgi:hypothetical protein